MSSRGRLNLIADPYERRPDGTLCIVPPLWQKSFDSAPFHDIWLRARRSFTATKALLVIGYSLPLTDVYTQAMLRIDVQELDFLLLANPDAVARSRIKRVLRSALSPTTRLIEVDSLEDVGRLLVQPAGPFERMKARLTYDTLNFRDGDVGAVIDAGQGDELVRIATGPTAHGVKQRHLIQELLLLGQDDRAVAVAAAMNNRSELVNTLLSATDLSNAGAVQKRALQAIADVAWPRLSDDQRRRVFSPLLDAGIFLPQLAVS